MSIQVSVVVPTFNRPHLLCHCLAALLAQAFNPAAFEVIVVDDGAGRRVRRLVERWQERNRLPQSQTAAGMREFAANGAPAEQARLRASAGGQHGRQSSPYPQRTASAERPRAEAAAPCLRYIAVTGPKHGPAAARNYGWRAARGEIIAFTDDDCLPQPGWLRAGVAALTAGSRKGVVVAAGRTVVPIAKVPTDYELNAAQMQNAGFVTANCFLRRDVLAEVGGFDERFSAAWREDSDLFFTLLERYGDDGRFICAAEAVVVHPPRRPVPWGVSLSEQRKSLFNALLYKKHPELYRTMIQPSPPWRYYQIVAALLLGVAGAWSGQIVLAGIALAAWLLLTGNLCRQRLRQTSRAPAHVAEMAITSAAIPALSIFWRLAGAVKFRVWFF